MANSMGGEARNQFRSRDRCIEPAMVSVEVLDVCRQAARPSEGGWAERERAMGRERERETKGGSLLCLVRVYDDNGLTWSVWRQPPEIQG